MSYHPRSVVALSGGRGWLTAESAASIHRIDAQIGHRLQITEAGRSWDEQNAHWLTYQRNGYPIALNPNAPSVHQIGDAVDSDEAQQILHIMADHGWVRTVYRWVNGQWTLVERWHFEHFIEKDNYRSGGNVAGSEDDMTPEQDRRLEAVFQALFGAANVPANTTGKITWAKPYGEKPGEAQYGLLDIAIYSQSLIAKNAGVLAGVQAAVAQLSAGSGVALNMDAIEAAAERGAKDALRGLVLSADVD